MPVPNLSKYPWPQDVLVNPVTDGQSQDPINAKLGREAFSYVSKPIAYTGAAFRYVEPFIIPPTCMFWAANWSTIGWRNTTFTTFGILSGAVTIIDNATGFRPIDNVRAVAMGYSYFPGLGATTSVSPCSRSTMPKPYCFRRGNSFTLEVEIGAVLSANFFLQVKIEGWKDYSYA